MMNTAIDNTKKQEVMDTILKRFKEIMEYELKECVIVESVEKSILVSLMTSFATERYFAYKSYDSNDNTKYEIVSRKPLFNKGRIINVKTMDGFEASVKLTAEEWNNFKLILDGIMMVFSTKLAVKNIAQHIENQIYG